MEAEPGSGARPAKRPFLCVAALRMKVAVPQRDHELLARFRLPFHLRLRLGSPWRAVARRRARGPARRDLPVRNDHGFDMGERFGE
jgi:hypothetical protein